MKRDEVNRRELSPMMLQYMEIKDNYKEELLFFRLGDFYELFFEDAYTASHELELTLTGKNAGLKERIPMCGIPHHSAKTYIEKLIEKGFKVAICEQMEDPKTTKGMVKREVVEVITKGTMVDLEFLNENDFNYIGSVLDLNYIYLLTYIDISTGEVNASFIEYKDSSLINEIINLNIKELVIIDSFNNSIIGKLSNHYNLNISFSNEFLENDYNTVYEDIEDERVILGLKHLMYYLSVKELKDLSHLTKVNVLNKEDYLKMDIHTIRNLELVETLRLKERKYSLIWLLDKTKTAMGARRLRNWLMSPLKEIDKINERYNYIDTLNNNFLLREELSQNLYEVYDLERLCGKVICGSLNARDVLQIKKSLSVIPNINRIVSELKLNFKMDTLTDLYELLESSIYEEPPISIKEGYLIKHGYNLELDELKSIRSGGKEFISNIENKLKQETDIQNLKVGFNKVFGYYIEISKGQLNKVDPSWERRQTLTNAERFITPELKEKEALVLNAEEKIVELEYNLFNEIRSILKKNIFRIKNVARIISEIDVYVSLSIASEEYHLIRPTLTVENELKIIEGRHPVVEVVNQNQYIKNDIIMDNDTSILLITGPNMSGKSTYMRQLAITSIMAQMGSFVPASDAIIPIFDAIYTRIGASDDLVSGESTFMVEMMEAKTAITNATTNSLILFDELGRGTATYDGMSLAASILEYISKNIKCKTLFSTHYHELTDLENKFSNIKNIHVDAKEENGTVTFLHKIKSGPIDKSYGIHVAALAGMPNEVLKRANEYLSMFENNDNKGKFDTNVQLSMDFQSSDNNKLKEYIGKLDVLNMTPIEAINHLYKIKEISKQED